MSHVIVIGAGISGLASAYWIKKQGHQVMLLEKKDRPGGVIGTVREDGYLFEIGPNAFLDNIQETLDLCSELNLHNEMLKQSMRDNDRFIYKDGVLHKVSPGPSFLKSPLLTKDAKWKLYTEVFRGGVRDKADESLASFIRRRFGEDLLKNLVTPFVSGVYAGDPEKLSLRATFSIFYELEREYGSVVRGGILRALTKKKSTATKKKRRTKNLCSFIEGMSVLIQAMAASLGSDLRLACGVKEVRKNSNGGFLVETESGENLSADAVVLAVSSYQAAEMASSLIPGSTAYLRSIPYNKLSVLGMGYRRADVAFEASGFGFLVPREQNIRILGSIWSSSLFPRRAPQGESAFTVFIGGGLDPQSFDLSDEDLFQLAHRDLTTSMGIHGEPVIRRIFRWEHAIPQYPVGHVEEIEKLETERAQTPGFFLAGNYLEGVSTNDCVYRARQVASEVQRFFQPEGK